MYDIIIIGAGCAGMTAGIYAARAGAKVVIIESEGIGGQIASSPKIDNFPAFESLSGAEFSDKLYEQTTSFGVDFEFDTILNVEKKEEKHFIAHGESADYEGKSVILALGMKHRTLGLEREDELVGCGLSYCAVCDGPFYENGTVAVAGGGNTAFQMAIYLSGICKKVYLIHRRNAFAADQMLVDKANAIENIEYVTPYNVVKLNGDSSVESITIKNKEDGSEKDIPLECLFVAIGNNPNTGFIRDIIECDEVGFIKSSEMCTTNIKGIFAAGDCRVKTLRQLVTASNDGAIAATNAFNYVKD